jgi:ABC-type branched-subunit amino acid transport system substrate-binding protein
VTGLGVSVEETARSIKALGRAGPQGTPIAMVGSVITADGLSHKPGLVRVAPSNSDEAQAAAAYLKGRLPGTARPAKAMLVQDTNRNDDYAATLGAAFRKTYPDAHHRLVAPVETFNSSLPAAATIFTQMQSDICLQRPDVIFFSGRGYDLKDFLHALARRTCTGKHITVMSGDDGSILAEAQQQPMWDQRSANFDVAYTALANPGAWVEPTKAIPQSAVDEFGSCTSCFRGMFPDEDLDDQSAIMSHDAVATAVQAVRSAVTQQELYPKPAAVSQEWNLLRGVEGASGWISFDGDSHGDPINKAVAIVRIKANGTTDFLKLSSPTGHPPTGPVA